MHQLELTPDVAAPSIARNWLASCFAADLDETNLATLKLLASELVTNAVLHGQGEITVRAELDDCRLCVEVIDRGAGFEPPPVGSDADKAGGWGLSILAGSADRWGAHKDAAHVWFELDRPQKPEQD